MFKTLEFRDGVLHLLDQTRLPAASEIIECRQVDDVVEAITSLRVRGAPAIGCAGAYGAVVASHRLEERGLAGPAFSVALHADLDRIARARPTAVNLSWAIQRMRGVARACDDGSPCAVTRALRQEADTILLEDEHANRALGAYGADIIPDGARVLTHCNAGALATGSYGTALGVIRAAHDRGQHPHVWVDETRPLLQGARLTAWELENLGIPYTLITDSMAGYFMARGEIDVVVVGADRIAANGDTANKIGTYSVAVLANVHHIPFYVAAPTSTVDLSTTSGEAIPIEERRPQEVAQFQGIRTAPRGARVANPAFDVTPSHMIAGIITEHGIVRPPFGAGLRDVVQDAARGVQSTAAGKHQRHRTAQSMT